MATGKNSFKELEQENAEKIGNTPEQVEHELMGIVQSGHFFGDVVELYFSKMINMVMALFGSEPGKKSD